MRKRAYQSDQLDSSNHKKQKQTYSVDKNKIRAKIEERKRKLEEKKNNQIVQEATKRRCTQTDKKHTYLSFTLWYDILLSRANSILERNI